ncbi:MAG: aromatic-ring-hydroxylating dioxygenase subunit beta [Alphaproteobacteria bacterium]|jgi:anthranilate 1,2-dioxygenase small subunit|nr:aromatic-ring-hydroxylating dioxygenase subunit beta [Alphaproteobacteria bacterium]
MAKPDTHGVVSNLLAEYAACIDADELERWPGFFTEQAHYRITTEFNHARELPVGIIDARNRNMLEDRVASLRKANIYEPQRYRHIISAVRLTGEDGDTVRAEASFMVVRTMIDGSQDLFLSGRYLDKIDLSDTRPLFLDKLVILDSDKIDTLLAIPL